VYIPPQNYVVVNHLQVDLFDKLEEGVETYEPLVEICINGDSYPEHRTLMILFYTTM